MHYRKKPVVIEAMQWTGKNIVELSKFCPPCWMDHYFNFYIKTLEGNMSANVGDYIIKGVKGEFYPCREDIFLETYEVAYPYDEEVTV